MAPFFQMAQTYFSAKKVIMRYANNVTSGVVFGLKKKYDYSLAVIKTSLAILITAISEPLPFL